MPLGHSKLFKKCYLTAFFLHQHLKESSYSRIGLFFKLSNFPPPKRVMESEPDDFRGPLHGVSVKNN
jgi:hypothetical protein